MTTNFELELHSDKEKPSGNNPGEKGEHDDQRPPTEGNSDFETLPSELLAQIAGYLGPQDAGSFGATAKRYGDIINDVGTSINSTDFIRKLTSLSQTPLMITEKENKFGVSLQRAKAVFDEVALAQLGEIQYVNENWKKDTGWSFWSTPGEYSDRDKLSKMIGPAATLAELEDRDKCLNRLHYKRIKGCLNEGETSLKLQKYHLTRFPASILKDETLKKYWAALKELHLSNNKLATLPPELGNLQALEHLDLDNNKLATLPPEIGELRALQYLLLKNNELTTLPPEIGKLIALEHLDLDNNKLATLPPEIGELRALQYLLLKNNELSTLPPEIGELRALQYLDLKNNELTTLPAQIGELAALEYLYLNNNELTTLPPEIGKLAALKKLYLDNNKLATLPAQIGKLAELKHLDLDNNELTTLPAQISKLAALEYLYLNNNKLTTLPAQIGKLAALKKLYLDNNKLTTLPAQIGELAKLEYLYLNNNQLTTLPPEVGKLAALKYLYLDNNKLATLPPGVLARCEQEWVEHVLSTQQQVKAPEPRRMRL